ncbi:MAG: CO dehydrogenase/acetyl-CoA synthase complex subunit epsilon [Candidatus Bathyarchaeia archaeon]|nr:CO dehydrogenase/acetyl-CoA synthase complex subunit epsilon [Candidatus Bathyarchaeota archaeon]
MAAKAEPWQTAEVPGPKKAMVITNPRIVAALIRRSKNPVLIVGSMAPRIKLSGGDLVDYAIRIAEAAGMPIVSSPSVLGEFLNRGFRRVLSMPVVDIANRLTDADWKGVENKGQHDLAIFMGFKYHVCWLILSGLKHYSQNLKTVSLEMRYQPHALWSFPNISEEEWEKNLNEIIKEFKQDKMILNKVKEVKE